MSVLPGEEGFCHHWTDPDNSNLDKRTLNESARPRPGSGWGFCNPTCQSKTVGGHGYSSKLMETSVNLLTKAQCLEIMSPLDEKSNLYQNVYKVTNFRYRSKSFFKLQLD